MRTSWDGYRFLSIQLTKVNGKLKIESVCVCVCVCVCAIILKVISPLLLALVCYEQFFSAALVPHVPAPNNTLIHCILYKAVSLLLVSYCLALSEVLAHFY